MSFLFEEPIPAFRSSLDVASSAEALYLAFDARGDVLVERADNSLLTFASATRHGLSTNDTHPLGVLGETPVHIALLEGVLSGGALPENLRTTSVRRLFGALDISQIAVAAMGSQLAHFIRNNQFCGRCAKPLVAVAGERARRCEACERDVYPSIHPCAIVLVHDGDRIVMTRTKLFPKGFYGLVAGFLEMGETVEQCAAREVLEEVGLEVEDVSYVASQPWPFPSQLMLGLTARYRSGELVVDTKELEDARWFDLDALPPLPPPLSIARHLIDLHLAARKPSS
ncbi:MAG: NAD(+) diphosphatase [Polyangiaceae bacterium]